MKIKFKNITLTNFLSFGQATLSLCDNGYTLVSGINENPDDLAVSNGSGKSSIWEAISWCLTGETIRGTKDVVRIGSNNGCSVTLEFQINNDNYKVVRTKDPTNLHVFINNVDKSGKGIRDTEKLLQDYIPDLTSSLIGSVIILGQGLPQRFTNNSPSGRKEVLEKLSKSDFMISDLKDRISRRKLELTSQLRETEDLLLQNNTKLTMINQQTELDKTKLESMSDVFIKDCLDKANEEYNHLVNDIDETTKLKESTSTKYTEVTSEIEKLQNECNTKKEEISAKYNPIIQAAQEKCTIQTTLINSLTKEIQDLDNVKDICPTCGQKLPNVHKIDTTSKKKELAELKEKYNDLNKELQDQKESYNQEINSIQINYEELLKNIKLEQTNLFTLQKQYDSQLYGLNTSLVKARENIGIYTTSLQNFQSDKETLLNRITENDKTKNEIDASILYNNIKKEDISNRIDIVNKMSTSVTRDFRGYLLVNVIDFINKKSKEYAKEVFETDKLEFALEGNNISISYDNKEYECLSGGEKQKVDLIVQLAIRDMLCKFLDFSSNIIVLDELFDNLDNIGCQRVLNLISNQLSDVESIFIVTHHSDISIPADKEIIVVKGQDKISRIK